MSKWSDCTKTRPIYRGKSVSRSAKIKSIVDRSTCRAMGQLLCFPDHVELMEPVRRFQQWAKPKENYLLHSLTAVHTGNRFQTRRSSPQYPIFCHSACSQRVGKTRAARSCEIKNLKGVFFIAQKCMWILSFFLFFVETPHWKKSQMAVFSSGLTKSKKYCRNSDSNKT